MTPLSPIPELPHLQCLPWYAEERVLPPYRFVPGLHPHPIRSPQGHSRRPVRARKAPLWSPDQWSTLERYLHGVDLFNRYYFWEAHEEWETLWRSHPPDSDPALFMQGLINTSASFLKLHMGKEGSADKLIRAASAQLCRFEGKTWMGLRVSPFLGEIHSYLAPLQKKVIPRLGPETPTIQLFADC